MLVRLALGALLLAPSAAAQFGEGPRTSGAPLSPAMAAYDVQSYDISLSIYPERREVSGFGRTAATVVAPTDAFEIHLDDAYEVQSVSVGLGGGGSDGVAFTHAGGVVRAPLSRTAQPGEALRATVIYRGAPPVAERPPWSGGFTWAETADGRPWVAVSCQGEGADVWWPVKDHPSDEADEVWIELDVPVGLRAVSNGRFEGRRVSSDGDRATERWHVTTPINNYGVSFGAAPYDEVTMDYAGPTGTTMPVTFYVLPERAADARRQLPGFLDALGFLERTFGPYAFAEDGYKVLHTPYLGMEHQTLIAYGSTFQDNAYGFDWLHFHELAHEWWANAATAPDWRDFWIHESFANYAEALYAEDLAARAGGDARAAYLDYIADVRGRITNTLPVAPRETRTTKQMYTLPDSGFNGDIYFKGSWFLHTLRFLFQDDDAFLAVFPAILQTADGPRFVSTVDVERALGDAFRRARPGAGPLAPYAEVYLRHAALPRLDVVRGADGAFAELAWTVPGGVEGFELPVPVRVGGDRPGGYQIVPMPGGRGRVALGEGATLEVDPDGEILFSLAD